MLPRKQMLYQGKENQAPPPLCKPDTLSSFATVKVNYIINIKHKCDPNHPRKACYFSTFDTDKVKANINININRRS